MFLAATEPPPDPVHVLIHALWLMWPLWLIVAGIGAVKLLAELYRIRRLRRAGIFEIDRMSGPVFEQRLALLFRSLGYRAEIIGSAGGDFGGDLILKKDNTKTVVQAKCWKQNVGVKAVQEIVGARGYYDTDAAMVVSNARFTKQAQELARKNQVKLWGRDELVVALLKAQKGSRNGAVEATPTAVDPPPPPAAAAPPPAADGTPPPMPRLRAPGEPPPQPFCARCGEAVTEKVRDYCLARPERFHGLVYCFRDQRAFKRH